MSHSEEILARVESVPSLPTTGVRAIGMIQDPEVGIAEVMRVIEYDPGLTTNVLRLANSAYFAGSRPIVSLRDAGVRLGLNRVFQLVMTLAVSRWASQPVRGYGMSSGDFLKHSIAVAIGAEQLAAALGRGTPPHVFTAGLLHDLGKIVLGTFIEVDATPIMKLAFEEQISFEVAEQRVLGIDHAEVGGVLLENWDLPAEIAQGVRMHHRPLDLEGDAFVVDLIHVADNLCLESGIGIGVDGLNYRPSEVVAQRLRLEPLVCETVVCRIATEVEELDKVLDFNSTR